MFIKTPAEHRLFAQEAERFLRLAAAFRPPQGAVAASLPKKAWPPASAFDRVFLTRQLPAPPPIPDHVKKMFDYFTNSAEAKYLAARCSDFEALTAPPAGSEALTAYIEKGHHLK